MAEAIVRLACVKHAASVRSEPGSNSQVDILITQDPRGRSKSLHHTKRLHVCRIHRLFAKTSIEASAACASLPSLHDFQEQGAKVSLVAGGRAFKPPPRPRQAPFSFDPGALPPVPRSFRSGVPGVGRPVSTPAEAGGQHLFRIFFSIADQSSGVTAEQREPHWAGP